MLETLARWFWGILAAYTTAGVLFAVPFVVRGIGRVDHSAVGGSWGFRLIVFPGVVALWPLLAARWASGRPRREERNPHRDAARAGGER